MKMRLAFVLTLLFTVTSAGPFFKTVTRQLRKRFEMLTSHNNWFSATEQHTGQQMLRKKLRKKPFHTRAMLASMNNLVKQYYALFETFRDFSPE